MYQDDWFWHLVLQALKDSGKKIPANKIPEVVQEVISKTIPESADVLLKELKSKSSQMLKERRRYGQGFEKRLFQRWKKPIDLLETFLVIALEAGAEFNKEYRDEASKTNNYKFDVLTRLHARGCQIGSEILSLLKHGFADGAYARWRTLHEIACVSFFIWEHGQDAAKRFLQYEIIVSYRQALAYQKHCRELGYEPLSEKELAEIKKARASICKIYGKDFRQEYPYGWISKKILKKRSFTEIEKHVKLDKLRPYYNMACYNIHSGPKGILFKLGLIQDRSKRELLLAGPSNFGLADPGQSAAISLCQITTCLLSTKPTMMGLITIRAMQNLVPEICEAFCEIQFQIMDEEKALASGNS